MRGLQLLQQIEILRVFLWAVPALGNFLLRSVINVDLHRSVKRGKKILGEGDERERESVWGGDR